MRTIIPTVLLVAACARPAPPAAIAPTPTVTLHIAAMNDWHGALYEMPAKKDPSRALGGLPWLKAAIDSLRTEYPDLLLLDAGDVFQGHWPVNATQGRGAVEAFNLLGVDAGAVGNHEFDYGGIDGGHPLRGALEAGGKLAEWPWLAANIHHEDGSPWAPEGFAPYTVIERSGVRVGIIGLTTEDTPNVTLAKNVADLRFGDVVEAVKNTLPKLEEEGAQVTVVVGHLTGSCEPDSYITPGEPCKPSGEVGRLLDELPAGTIDVLIVGHAHTLLHHRWQDTIVLEQRARGHALGRVDLVVGKDGVDLDASTIHPAWFLEHAAVDPGCEDKPYPTGAQLVGGRALTPDADALTLIDELEAEAGSLCEEVGCTSAHMGRTREAQSPVGDVVSDTMLAAFDGVDLALQNSGGLRADLPQGTIRREDLQQVMPFDNRLLLVEMTGEQVMTVLQIGSSGAHGILQIAGGTYGFDPEAETATDLNGDGKAEEWETDRLCDERVTLGGAPVDPEKTYRVVTTDFLFNGGDHLGHAFADLKVAEEGPLLREAMNTWFEGLESCLAEPTAERISLGACAQ